MSVKQSINKVLTILQDQKYINSMNKQIIDLETQITKSRIRLNEVSNEINKRLKSEQCILQELSRTESIREDSFIKKLKPAMDYHFRTLVFENAKLRDRIADLESRISEKEK
jgi:hypothetical protein